MLKLQTLRLQLLPRGEVLGGIGQLSLITRKVIEQTALCLATK